MFLDLLKAPKLLIEKYNNYASNNGLELISNREIDAFLENVNNINVPHLHFGLQLIFDESQVDGNNEIWIDVYNIIEFLMKNRSEVFMNNSDTKDFVRKYNLKE